ncbi:MAG: hypothetical protein OHK0035_36030 [Cyanobacteria bacterium J069]
MKTRAMGGILAIAKATGPSANSSAVLNADSERQFRTQKSTEGELTQYLRGAHYNRGVG